jgi:hypothetical protein
MLEQMEKRELLSVFTITNTNDNGPGSLRQAILNANANSGLDLINFNIAATGVQTIMPLSALPTITDPVIIDGTSEPGFAGTPIIELDGASAGAGVTGLTLFAGNSTVQGLVINRFSGDGIDITGSGATGNVVAGNYIGTDVTGTVALGNNTPGQHAAGIFISAGAQNNIIGGTTPAARNVISGNIGEGIEINDINGQNTSGNVVEGNYIGTDVTGTVALGNRNSGVFIAWGVNNTIGGTTPGAGNVISGNQGFAGIAICGAGFCGGMFDNGGGDASGNVVEGNLIGTNAAGNAAVANLGFGISVDGVGSQGGVGDVIGGTAAGARNIISANARNGIDIFDFSQRTTAQGNFIGTDITGTVALGNSANGILIESTTSYSTIGGTAAGGRNVISGNQGDGLQVGANSAGNVISGNYLGTNAAGTAGLGNAGWGVNFQSASINTVSNNVISGNTLGGVNLSGNGALAGTVSWWKADGNANDFIGNNNGTLVGGATFGPDVTAGAGQSFSLDGSSGFVNVPNSSSLNFGTGDFSVELWVNFNNTSGEQVLAEKYVETLSSSTETGWTLTKLSTNAVRWAFAGGQVIDTPVLNLSTNTWIHFAATRSAGVGTIYMNGTAIASGTVAVNVNSPSSLKFGHRGNPSDTPGSNDTRGFYVNGFIDEPAIYNRALSASEIQTIYNLGGASKGGNLVQGNFIGTNAAGAAAIPNGAANNYTAGVYINNSADNTIGGTTASARNVISGNGSASFLLVYGIWISGSNATGNVVEGNYVGTDATGSQPLGNARTGIAIVAAPGNTIGGTATGAGNVISANGESGIYIQWAASSGNLVEGNLIGTDASGSIALGGNSFAGVTIDGAPNNIIGGPVPAAANIIAGNAGPGVRIYDQHQTGAATGNVVAGNFIGTNSNSAPGLGNQGDGVLVTQGAFGNTIGGGIRHGGLLQLQLGNVISGNAGAGIDFTGAGVTGNLVASDVIGTNAAGTAALPNVNGVVIQAGASGNTVGGANSTSLTFTNLISGNSQNGVLITGGGTTGNVVEGNLIGTNSSGTAALGNSQYGVYLNNASLNSILGNTISGNASDGININGNGTYTNFSETFEELANGSLNGQGGWTGYQLQGGVFAPYSGDVMNLADPGPHLPTRVINGFDVASPGNFGVAQHLFVLPTAGLPVIVFSFDAYASSGVSHNSGMGLVSAPTPGGPNLDYLSWQINRFDGGWDFADQISGPTVGYATHGGYDVPVHLTIVVDERSLTVYGRWNFGGGQTGETPHFPVSLASIQALNAVVVSQDWRMGSGGIEVDNLLVQSTGNIVQGNVIGTNTAGTAALANGGNGITISASAGNLIGGTAAGAGNVISGNSADGIFINGVGASNNWVAGNFIGTDKTGKVKIGANNGGGVVIRNGAANNLVGVDINSANPSAGRNIISGNNRDGISIFDVGTNNNRVAGNYIGVDATGEVAMGNRLSGVAIDLGASSNLVGSLTGNPLERNVIAANIWGLFVRGHFNTIAANYIGTDAAGSIAFGNGTGVLILDAQNTVGGTVSGAGNVISGNTGNAVEIDNALAVTSGTLVAGNLIGTNAAGTAALPNAGDGVAIQNGASNNTIGGTTAAARNIISGNAGNGAHLTGSGTTGNVVEGNYIGTDVTGMAALGNGLQGVLIDSGAATNAGSGGLARPTRWSPATSLVSMLLAPPFSAMAIKGLNLVPARATQLGARPLARATSFPRAAAPMAAS